MDPLFISGIIVFAVLGLIGVAYINHALENAKLERARKVAEGNDRVRRIDYMLADLPTHYLQKGLLTFLLSEKLFTLKQMLPYAPKDQQINVQKRIELTQEEMEAPPAPATTPLQISSESQAAEIQSLLQDAHRVLVTGAKAGRVSKADAKKYNALLKHLLVVTSYDAFRNMATQARREGKIKLALHHYMRASADLTKNNDNNQYTEQIQKLRTLIKHLQEEEERSRNKGKAQPAAETDNQLSQKLDEITSPEDEWKKKNVYD
ncbi:hypothetical protein [Aestuariirhabdus litorea]|uniref:DNA repair protein n=1 Tax=Aestuariirhabdus litorea TaxID=2528527 RepID=A0A3P3VS03_9GAMM|nr:hypothetical protein [Aestuariirhabdus litorea]RRJ84476.1 hypothetical protein D0544_05050 [Aestuariirhabdus litorea]RWW97700.1 hypothetical protein DZC74_05040 [Endozoicomonadaceae bacterium GTF-13]